MSKTNKEVAKAINKKENKFNAIKKWWDKNGYKVMRVVLFPIWWGIKAKRKIDYHLNSREKWSEEELNNLWERLKSLCMGEGE